MQELNESTVTEFILLGFASNPRTNPLLFTFFLVFYLLILVSNSLLITLIHQDTRLHTPMYFFISVLSMLDMCYTTTTVPRMLVHILSISRPQSLASPLISVKVNRTLVFRAKYKLCGGGWRPPQPWFSWKIHL